MARGRGGAERREGRHRYSRAVAQDVARLAIMRADMDGMDGSDPDFIDTLNDAAEVAADIVGRAPRIDRGDIGRRAMLERFAIRSIVQLATEGGF